MQQKSESSIPKIDVKNQELLCLSLPYIKSSEHLQNKQNQILKNSNNQNYLPLSLVEQSLLEDK